MNKCVIDVSSLSRKEMYSLCDELDRYIFLATVHDELYPAQIWAFCNVEFLEQIFESPNGPNLPDGCSYWVES